MYRLLKALCSNFSLIQMSLFPHLGKFLEHVEVTRGFSRTLPPGVTHCRAVGQLYTRHASRTSQAKLVAHDISPTDCINAIFKDNVGAASQVSEDIVRQFVLLTTDY